MGLPTPVVEFRGVVVNLKIELGSLLSGGKAEGGGGKTTLSSTFDQTDPSPSLPPGNDGCCQVNF